MIFLNYHSAPLELSNFETFEEKMNIVISYLEIHTILCKLPDAQVPDYNYMGEYDIEEIYISPGAPYSVKSLIKSVLKPLEDSLTDFVENHEDYYSIKKILENIKDACLLLIKKNDITKSIHYNDFEIKHLALYNGRWQWLYQGQVVYNESVARDMVDHYAIRKEFFEEIAELIDKKLKDHLEIAAYPHKSYQWNSPNPHLEIAELVYSIIHTKLAIRKGEQKSMAKFVKEFYNLFGLDDALYHAKVQQIRNRTSKDSWLQLLPDYINARNHRPSTAKKNP